MVISARIVIKMNNVTELIVPSFCHIRVFLFLISWCCWNL